MSFRSLLHGYRMDTGFAPPPQARKGATEAAGGRSTWGTVRLSHFVAGILFSVAFAALSGCQQANYEQEEFSPETIQILTDLQPRQKDVGDYRLYYPANSLAANDLDTIVQQLEASKAKVLAILREPQYELPLNILLVDSREDMKSLVNLSNEEFTIPPDRFSILVYDGERNTLFSKALFKNLAVHFWGNPRDRVMFEGGANFTQGSCAGVPDPVVTIPAEARKAGQICSIRDLVFDYGSCSTQYPVTTRMQAASIFQLLYDGFGLDDTKVIWSRGIRNLERHVGMTPAGLAREWGYIMDNVTPYEIDLESLNRTGCR